MISVPPALRRLALAVAVLYDVDLMPQDAGLTLTGRRDIRVSWETVSSVVDAALERDGRERSQLEALAGWLNARRAVEHGTLLVALGFPVRHTAHPGPAWIREVIPGNALSLGFGYGPEHLPLPAGVLEHAGVDSGACWSRARDALEELGTLAAQRDRRRLRAAIVPLGDADVVTLMGATSLRRELAAAEGDGMAAMIVPLRTRGWRATFVSDPAYGPALAAAMPPEERGFDRPLLVTAEELSEVRAGGDPMRLLRDDAEEA